MPGVGPDWLSLPQIFKRSGHLSLGAGKLYHPGLPPNYDGDNSWSAEALDWPASGEENRDQTQPFFNPIELNSCAGEQDPACTANPVRTNPACAGKDPCGPIPHPTATRSSPAARAATPLQLQLSRSLSRAG